MFTLVFTVALAGAAPVPKEDDNEKALKAIQGKWKVVAAEEKGKAGNANDFDVQVIAVEGNVLTERRDGKEVARYGISLEPSKSPAHLDLVWLDEKGKLTPRVAHAIYKLEGGRLTICFGHNMTPDKPEDRPREFKTGPPEQRPQKGKVMFSSERVKE
jgi:uncharacterized protein (TIGR03067 family)